MRRLSWLALVVVPGLLGACSSPEPTEGAVLTFQTPEGPMSATRIEVVLANSADEAITDIDNQRVEPGSDRDDAVRYYRQRAYGGEVVGMKGLTGFKLRIAPDAETAADEVFIPFVLAYEGDTLIGVGVIEDDNGDPSGAQVLAGMLTNYDVTMMAVTATDADEQAVDRGKARAVWCKSDGVPDLWKSGVAWFPTADPARPDGRAHQLRLLLPEPDSTDATERAADLDCDAHPATVNDCDDLRNAYYNGAPESCDGVDTNCDSVRYSPQTCTAANTTCTLTGGVATGVQICDDQEGELTACTPSAACMCAQGGSCTKCFVDFTGTGGTKTACSPSVGKVLLSMCEAGGSCTVVVGGATNGWRAYIGTSETASFTTTLTGVHGFVYLEVKGSGTPGQTTGSVGEAYLLVTELSGRVTTVPVELDMSQASACVPIGSPSTGSKMICYP